MSQTPPGSPATAGKKRKAPINTSTILLLIFSNGVSFLGGTFCGSNVASSSNFHKDQHIFNQEVCPPPIKCPVCPEVNECPDCPSEKECPEPEAPGSQLRAPPKTGQNHFNPFPNAVSRFAAGLAYTTQENFTKTYDLGVPIDRPVHEGEKGVLIIYSTPDSMPKRVKTGKVSSDQPLTADEATQNCDQMHVVSTYHAGRKRQCLAIVPQYESFHVQKWMRVPQKGKATGHDPLRMVPRGHQMNGVSAFHPPKHEKHTKKHWKMLETYLDSIDDILQELKPIVDKIAFNNAVVVMVCNFGQSQLLLNFACAARAKGLDISMVLVFATDEETRDLAESIGMTVYYDKRNFGSMPKKAAKVYGDGTFTNMMLSKVICVHMTMLLDVDLLFQDVDVLWYKNPLPYFQDDNSPISNFDALFQDDGSRSERFAPYSANSGFYYFRNNDRTKYFMTSFLMQSDLVLRSFSHQSAMIMLLAEHSSLLGLKVKVLDPFQFPAGFIYHRKKGKGPYGNFFVDLYKGKHDPYIFHMSWTENKHNKILFYRQLDQWYLQDKCMDTKVSDIPGLELGDGKMAEACCSSESLFSCHYADKPSSRPCRNSPTLDKTGKSYW